MTVGSVRKVGDIRLAAKLMRGGDAVAFYNRGVWALAGDGKNGKFINNVYKIKGQSRKGNPLAAFINSRRLMPLVDKSKVHDSLQNLFLDPLKYSRWFGSLCFFRLPITSEAVKIIPKDMVSFLENGTAVLQNWDPAGHVPAENVVAAMEEEGIEFHAITSFNFHGEPEIVDDQIAIEFAKKSGVKLVLVDPENKKKTQGGYTIFSLVEKEVHLVRHGNIPVNFFKLHFGDLTKIEGAKECNYKIPSFPEHLLMSQTPEEIRKKILHHLNYGK
ncbi:MAG: hypothetical protein Q7S14_02755 [bacterium]|nr:hypothetical protein [bacterium]